MYVQNKAAFDHYYTYRKLLPVTLDVLAYKFPSEVPKPCSSWQRDEVYGYEQIFCKTIAGKKQKGYHLVTLH